MTGLEGRAALVTGGGGGIGRAVCAALAAEGARVAIGHGDDEEAAQEVAAELRAGGAEAVVLNADLADVAAAEALADAAAEALGPLDVLVANAGIAPPATVPQVDAEAWDALMAVNLRAPYLLARRVLPGDARPPLRPHRLHHVGGRLHGRGRRAALRGLEGRAARPHALPRQPRGGRRRDGQRGGARAHRRHRHAPGRPRGELARRIPVGRLGRPDEVADLVAAVVRNGYLTNQVLSVDGGLHPR